jgi:hypothetical protein
MMKDEVLTLCRGRQNQEFEEIKVSSNKINVTREAPANFLAKIFSCSCVSAKTSSKEINQMNSKRSVASTLDRK